MANKKQATIAYRLLAALHDLRGSWTEDEPPEQDAKAALDRATEAALDFLECAIGPHISAHDRLLAQQDLSGLDEVFAAHGLLTPGQVEARKKALEAFRSSLSSAIQLPRAEGRTAVNCLLDSTRIKDPFVSEVDRGIDRVNLGTLSWEDFASRIGRKLSG